jgi:hypothetical protein
MTNKVDMVSASKEFSVRVYDDKTWEGSEFHLACNACHNFMNAVSRYETPG